MRGRVVPVAAVLLLVQPALAVAKAKPKPAASPGKPAVPGAPRREPAPTTYDEAGAHYQKGVEDFSGGRYDDAIVEFKLAYAAGGPPALLFNIAQAHRLAGHDKEALAYYKEYLRVVPDAPNRRDVEARMASIEHDLAAASRAQRGIEPALAPVSGGRPPGTTVAATGGAAIPLDARARPSGARPSSLLEPTIAPYHPGRKLKWTGVATVGAGVVSLGVGAYFGVEARGAAAELDARAARGELWTQDSQRLYERGDRDEGVALSLVIIGSAALVTGGVLSYVGWAQDVQAAEFAFVPTRGGAQAVMAWGF